MRLPRVTITSFGHGLIPDSQFYSDLIMEQPTYLDDLIYKTKKHSKLEEDKIQKGSQPDDRAPSSSTDKRKKECGQQKGKLSETSYKGINTVFTEPIYKVISKIKEKPIFKWPKAMPSNPSRRDPDRYCSYHKDHGHMTEKCKFLKLFLEDLVEKGHIPMFVKEVEQ